MLTVGRRKRWLLSGAAVLVLLVLLIPTLNWWSKSKTAEIAAACRKAIRLEHWDEAQSLADQWVRREPKEANAWLSMADVAKAKGDLAATAECLSRVPADDPRYLKCQMLRGDLTLDGLRKPIEAVEVWQEMLSVAPNATVAHQRLLYVYSMTLQRQKMVSQIRKAIKNRAEPPEAYGYMLAAPNLLFTDGYLRVGQWVEASPKDENLRVAQAIFAARTAPSRGMKMFGVDAVNPGDDSGVLQCLKEYPQNLELKAYLIEKAIADDDMTTLAKTLVDLPEGASEDCRFWRYIGQLRDFQRLPSDAAEAYQNSLTTPSSGLEVTSRTRRRSESAGEC